MIGILIPAEHHCPQLLGTVRGVLRGSAGTRGLLTVVEKDQQCLGGVGKPDSQPMSLKSWIRWRFFVLSAHTGGHRKKNRKKSALSSLEYVRGSRGPRRTTTRATVNAVTIPPGIYGARLPGILRLGRITVFWFPFCGRFQWCPGAGERVERSLP